MDGGLWAQPGNHGRNHPNGYVSHQRYVVAGSRCNNKGSRMTRTAAISACEQNYLLQTDEGDDVKAWSNGKRSDVAGRAMDENRFNRYMSANR